MIRRFFQLAVLGLLVSPALAAAEVEVYNVDPAHSQVGFSIRHFVAKVAGRFDDFTGTIEIDPKNPTTLSFTGEIQATSINTNQKGRDKHLRSAEFFDVENHPTITFKSKKVTKDGDDLIVVGDLTMLGVTKEITMEVELLGFGPGPQGKHRAGFEAKTKVNRKDFGMKWNRALDAGGVALGSNVKLTFFIEAVRK